ncbi:hypothetical protein [Mycolicibacterium sphagni]|uniref:Secreted protein n=1 Tax=Mycolicibacterium sphagni TaxID=1786 RepID=A0ABX2JRJ4_9MYCO|nr:hypothetical protein [Mycolicibacterium sphagni]NTY60323.1 hypothetical protein [Mycolicibacterium sphagni]
MKRLFTALWIVGCIAVVPVGVAHADCDTPGDFGAGSGCPPPGPDSSGGGSSTESWPPTSIDWPPQFDSALGGGDNEKSKAAPIVMPDGMAAQPATSTSPVPKPIVGAGSETPPSTSSATTPIVMPGS